MYKSNLNSCKFEGVYFYKISTESNSGIHIVKEFADVFQEILNVLTFRSDIGLEIEIISTLPGPLPIYRLAPIREKTPSKHLTEAMDKNLIVFSKSLFGTAFLLFKRRTSP